MGQNLKSSNITSASNPMLTRNNRETPDKKIYIFFVVVFLSYGK